MKIDYEESNLEERVQELERESNIILSQLQKVYLKVFDSDKENNHSSWIDIEKRKPPNEKYVLVAIFDSREKVKMHFITISNRINDDWFDYNDDKISVKGLKITHWMPLPDVPND